MSELKAPFPWYGGKGRWVADVLEMFGDIKVYAEPFAGSLAVLLGSPARNREIICDTDGMVCNAWRAIKADPAAVAYWADYPTFHQDLTARRYWLARWKDSHADRLVDDMDFYCSRAAGLWIYCLSSWIGASGDMLRLNYDKRPKVYDSMGGVGVQAQVLAKNLRPYVQNGGGRGVRIQRLDLANEKRPIIKNGGTGISAQRVDLGGRIGDGSRLSDWMYDLADRLARVIVLNRDWTSAVTPVVLQHGATSRKPPVGIFLDPPYLLGGRSDILYPSDLEANNPAREAYEWAVEHGDQYRIAYCGMEGDFPLPQGWTARYRTLGGVRDVERRRRLDCVMFSPACQKAQESNQPPLI